MMAPTPHPEALLALALVRDVIAQALEERLLERLFVQPRATEWSATLEWPMRQFGCDLTVEVGPFPPAVARELAALLTDSCRADARPNTTYAVLCMGTGRHAAEEKVLLRLGETEACHGGAPPRRACCSRRSPGGLQTR